MLYIPAVEYIKQQEGAIAQLIESPRAIIVANLFRCAISKNLWI